MTVKELIELNQCIGDITVTIRESNGLRIKGYHIGANEGEMPPYPDDGDVYKDVAINARDNGRDYHQLLINKIPKPLLELEVFSHSIRRAYRSDFIDTLEHIRIEVRNGARVIIKDDAAKEDKQLKGQMNLEF